MPKRRRSFWHFDLCSMQTLERIKGTVESGSYYEAQQMYKSVYHRHKARRQIQESYAVLHVRCSRPRMHRLQ